MVQSKSAKSRCAEFWHWFKLAGISVIVSSGVIARLTERDRVSLSSLLDKYTCVPSLAIDVRVKNVFPYLKPLSKFFVVLVLSGLSLLVICDVCGLEATNTLVQHTIGYSQA
jgi:hypothetical protein